MQKHELRNDLSNLSYYLASLYAVFNWKPYKFPHRGEIYWVDLEPIRVKETQKIRPGLIVSNDIGNEFSKIVMIAPITSKVLRIYPTEVKTTIDGKEAKIMLHQCRAIDQSRLSKQICEVSLEEMAEVEKEYSLISIIIKYLNRL